MFRIGKKIGAGIAAVGAAALISLAIGSLNAAELRLGTASQGGAFYPIGQATPPLGISCFVIKTSLNDPTISLKDVFMGALPFAFIMLLVLILLIAYPVLSIGILG